MDMDYASHASVCLNKKKLVLSKEHLETVWSIIEDRTDEYGPVGEVLEDRKRVV